MAFSLTNMEKEIIEAPLVPINLSTLEDIQYAIKNKLQLNIYYDSPDLKGNRRVYPVALGYHTKSGNLCLRAYVLRGNSYTKGIPSYRLFLVSRISQLNVTATKFNVPFKYRRNDKHLSVITQI